MTISIMILSMMSFKCQCGKCHNAGHHYADDCLMLSVIVFKILVLLVGSLKAVWHHDSRHNDAQLNDTKNDVLYCDSCEKQH